MTGKTGMTGKTWMTRMTEKTRMTGKTRIRITVITECFVGQKNQVVKKLKKTKFFKGVRLLIFLTEKNAFLTRKCEVVKKFKKSKSF